MNDRIEAQDITLIYHKDLFSEDEIRALSSLASASELSFGTIEKRTAFIAASLDFFFPIVKIVISSALLSQIAANVISSFVYDSAKTIIKNVWKKISTIKPKKISGNKITDYENCIHLCCNGFDAVFPTTTDEAIINKYIDKLFSYLPGRTTKQTKYVVLDDRSGSLRSYTEAEIINMATKEQEEEKGQSVLCRVFDYLKNNPLSSVQAVAGALGIGEGLCLRAILELEARGAVKHTVRPLDNNDNSCYYSACEREFNDDSEYCLCKTRRIITSDVESSDLGYWDTCCVCGKHIEYGFHYYNHYDGEDHDDIDV